MSWSETDLLSANPQALTRLTTVAGTAQLLTDIGPIYARDLRIIDDTLGMQGRVLIEDVKKLPRAQDFGAVCDGGSRPVTQWYVGGARDRGYANLTALKVDYPHVTSATDEIDWAAAQLAINTYNSVGIYGTLRTNRALALAGTPKLVYGLGKNLSTVTTNQANHALVSITGN
jgi:hypothetical protein